MDVKDIEKGGTCTKCAFCPAGEQNVGCEVTARGTCAKCQRGKYARTHNITSYTIQGTQKLKVKTCQTCPKGKNTYYAGQSSCGAQRATPGKEIIRYLTMDIAKCYTPYA